MNTEELYIWRYGIDKLPKGLLEYGKSDVCDIYDESKRQKFQNLGQWMWQNNDGWNCVHIHCQNYRMERLVPFLQDLVSWRICHTSLR